MPKYHQKNDRISELMQSLVIRQKSENRPIHLDYSEVAAELVDQVREQYKIIDPGIFTLVEPEQELIAFLLADEYEAQLVWNCMNSTFGKGILIGLLVESIATYYAQLEAQANGNTDEDDYAIGDYDDGSF
jgi:hypothetical protein